MKFCEVIFSSARGIQPLKRTMPVQFLPEIMRTLQADTAVPGVTVTIRILTTEEAAILLSEEANAPDTE